jgi:putative transposase
MNACQSRSNWRDGGRARVLSIPAGDVELRSKVWSGHLSLAIRAAPSGRQGLWAVSSPAIFTRKVDDLVCALGCNGGVSESTVSRIRAEVDEQLAAFPIPAL